MRENVFKQLQLTCLFFFFFQNGEYMQMIIRIV